jgi:iron complex transport system substrate-binding protein
MMLAFTGCEDDVPEDDADDVTDLIIDEPDEPAPFPVIIAGVSIAVSPERVVSLSPSLSEIIYELGYGNRLISRSAYCDFPPGVLSLPVAGSSVNPDIDRIIALSPSLVLTTLPLSQKDMFRMEQSGITTLTVPAATGLNGLRDVYRALGLVFEGAFTGIEAGEEAFSVISRACDNKDVVNIGSFIYITGDFKAATGDTLEHSVFSCFGVNLAEGGRYYEFDLSGLTENQPDVILLSNKYTTADLLSSGYFGSLDAVTEGRVIYIDNVSFERPSARLVRTIEQMISDFRNI